jgi:predicted dehydrogenase
VVLDVAAELENRTPAEHVAFLAAIRGNMAPAVSWREALWVQRLLNAMYESAEAGEEVRLG